MVASAEVITADSEKYVEQLLELFRRFSLLVSQGFRDDPRFLTSRDKAYKRVVNDTSIFKLDLPATRWESQYLVKKKMHPEFILSLGRGWAAKPPQSPSAQSCWPTTVICYSEKHPSPR